MNQQQLETAARHYLIAAIWADAPEGTRPRATAAAHSAALKDVQQFAALVGPQCFAALMDAHNEGYGAHPDCGKVEPAAAAMGHDIWLSCRGHGTGFFDRDELPEIIRDICMDACRKMGDPSPVFYGGWLYL